MDNPISQDSKQLPSDSLAEAWAKGAAVAWRESGIRAYGDDYAELPDNGFIPFSVAVKNPYTHGSVKNG